VDQQVRIGYSFWGFLGHGITDTPDGGRAHRRPFIDALLGRGHDVVFLQADRDRLEAADGCSARYAFDAGMPAIDVLFLEWRWPVTGRSTTPCGTPGHTCDLHRQADLLRHYTTARRTPTVIWDKDRQLSRGSRWRQDPAVAVCEAALAPSGGARRLLFPVDDLLLDQADPARLAARPRPLALGYAGSQYDRDEEFSRFLAPAAARFSHQVAGKWAGAGRWPQVTFTGRIPFPDVARLYGQSLATILLLPARYQAAGQMTQRLFEAVLEGCLPLAPGGIRYASRFVPAGLVVADGAAVIEQVTRLRGIAGTGEHARLIAACLARLELFRLSRQVTVLDAVLDQITARPARGGAASR
jgi:hypothetical protein